jgi:hypothetical protein
VGFGIVIIEKIMKGNIGVVITDVTDVTNFAKILSLSQLLLCGANTRIWYYKSAGTNGMQPSKAERSPTQ